MLKTTGLKLLIITGFMLIAADLFAVPGNISDLNTSASAPYDVQLTWTAPDSNDVYSKPSGYIVEISTAGFFDKQ